jgi:hypothetical protein
MKPQTRPERAARGFCLLGQYPRDRRFTPEPDTARDYNALAGHTDCVEGVAVSEAVYCYPLAHFDYWKKELPARTDGKLIANMDRLFHQAIEREVFRASSSAVAGRRSPQRLSPNLASLATSLASDLKPTTW